MHAHLIVATVFQSFNLLSLLKNIIHINYSNLDLPVVPVFFLCLVSLLANLLFLCPLSPVSINFYKNFCLEFFSRFNLHSCQLSQKPAKRINFYFIPWVSFLERDPATLQQWFKINLLTLLVEDNAILSLSNNCKWLCPWSITVSLFHLDWSSNGHAFLL